MFGLRTNEKKYNELINKFNTVICCHGQVD